MAAPGRIAVSGLATVGTLTLLLAPGGTRLSAQDASDRLEPTEESDFDFDSLGEGEDDCGSLSDAASCFDDGGNQVACGPDMPRATELSQLQLSGRWVGLNYGCDGQSFRETIRIDQSGLNIIATKETGDACVPAGNVTFYGRLGGSITCITGSPESPASSFYADSWSFEATNDEFEICGVTFKPTRAFPYMR